MKDMTYIQRACPACGCQQAVDTAHSERRAEDMNFDAVRPFWSGLFKEKVFFSYHRCADCGLLYAPRFFSDPQLDMLYSDMDPNMELVTTEAIAATQRGYFDEAIKAGAQAGGYLEIGPDVGHIVGHAAQKACFDHFWLFEPNRAVHAQLAAATAGSPHTISTEMTDLSAVPDGSVGLAVMVHVLDHLLDPVDMLSQIQRKLRPGGALVTVTHNEKSVLRHVMGTRWPPFCLQHPEVYNPQSITALMQRAGFGSVNVDRSLNYFPFDFMVKQAAWTARIDLGKVPLPKTRIGLRLGNILTTARA